MAARHGTLFECKPALRPAARSTLLLGVLCTHLVAAWALMQARPVRQAVAEAAPVLVSLVAAPPPSLAVQIPPAPQPRLTPAPPPAPRLLAVPAAVSLVPPPISAPAPVPEPVALPPQVAQPPAETSPAPPAPPAPPVPPVPAAPRAVPPSAVRYIVQPEPAYPPTSRRLGESGEVRLRVEIGTDGRARHVSVHHSSGFPRLDECAVAAVRAARFAPFIEDGVALVVWTIVPIAFELQG